MLSFSQTGQSKSTDKLKALLTFANSVPDYIQNKVKSLELSWSVVGNCVVPCVKVEFKD